MSRKTLLLISFLSILPLILNAADTKEEEKTQPKYSLNSNEDVFKNIVNGDIGGLKRALKNGGDPNGRVRDLTPLMIAAGNGNVDIINVLLENKADLNAKGDNGKTSLTIALRRNNLQTAQLLIEKGADINTRDDKGVTPLMWASYEGRLETVKFILKNKPEVNASNNKDRTALNYATEKNFKDIIATLKEAGAE
jgi:ankyrin repeat protein